MIDRAIKRKESDPDSTWTDVAKLLGYHGNPNNLLLAVWRRKRGYVTGVREKRRAEVAHFAELGACPTDIACLRGTSLSAASQMLSRLGYDKEVRDEIRAYILESEDWKRRRKIILDFLTHRGTILPRDVIKRLQKRYR